MNRPSRSLDDILDFFREGTAPPLAWAVEYSDGGRIDPVTAAWRASTDPYAILAVVHAGLGRPVSLEQFSAIAQAVLARGAWIHQRESQWRMRVADLLRRATRLSESEENVLVVERGAIQQYMDAVESATMNMLGPRHAMSDSQDVCAGMAIRVARAIAVLTRRNESDVMPEVCDAMRSAIRPEPSLSEMLTVIEGRR